MSASSADKSDADGTKEKKKDGRSKTADEIEQFDEAGISNRKKEVITKTLIDVHGQLVNKMEELTAVTETARNAKEELEMIKEEMEAQRAEYEKKLDTIKQQISNGLADENNAKESITRAVELIEKKLEVKIPPRDVAKNSKSAPKLDSSTPAYGAKSGERLDEWLYIMNTAFTRLKVTDGKERLKMASRS